MGRRPRPYIPRGSEAQDSDLGLLRRAAARRPVRRRRARADAARAREAGRHPRRTVEPERDANAQAQAARGPGARMALPLSHLGLVPTMAAGVTFRRDDPLTFAARMSC